MHPNEHAELQWQDDDLMKNMLIRDRLANLLVLRPFLKLIFVVVTIKLKLEKVMIGKQLSRLKVDSMNGWL